MNHKDTETLLKELLRNCNLALKNNHIPNSKDCWEQFWYEKTIKSITCANERIKSLGSGSMLVYDDSITPKLFWQDIMQTVKISIWTTNIVSLSTFGNELNQNLLLLQKEAIENNVKIIRLFIYDSIEKDQRTRLISTMANQLFHGIDIWAIERNRFNEYSSDSGEHLEQDDFMIIDDKYVYETSYNDESGSYRNKLILSEQELTSKRKIRNRVMKFAQQITLKNISSFPDIL